MSEETDPKPSADEPLVFDKAEDVAAPTSSICSLCKRDLGREYFTVNAAESCEDCHHLLSHQLKEAKTGTAFLRAAALGLVAALGGSIAWYAVAKITGMEIGLLAIAVGYIVGRAVRQGSRGPGGRRYQVLAMALTYLSITGSYVPAVMKSFEEGSAKHAVKDSAAASHTTTPAAAPASSIDAPATDPAAAAPPPQVGPLGSLILLIFILGVSLIAPFLMGASNIIGIVLIGIALYEAWKLNKPVPIVLGGPLRRKKKPVDPPVAPAPDLPAEG